MSLDERDDGYERGGLGEITERGLRRLESMQQMCDIHTFKSLAEVPIQANWHCLEIGAGAGSVARQKAKHVPLGMVTATDLNLSFLSADASNVVLLQHDVRSDDFPPESFDFIHARAVLQHLQTPELVLKRCLSLLRPDGWILIDEIDLFPGLSSPNLELRWLTTLLLETGRAIGTDNAFARRLPGLFAEAKLTQIGATYLGHAVGDRGAAQRVLEASLQQLQPAIVQNQIATPEAVAALQKWLGGTR